MTVPILAIVIPCYNEEDVFRETISRLEMVLNDLINQNIINNQSYILFVDDGSKDQTWSLINNFNKSKSFVRGLKLSRNFGHQYALLAGLHQVTDVDIVISIDADLQDDLNAIQSMVEAYQKGNEVVYGVREDRSSDTAFKRNTALLFYKFMNLLGVETVYNHADYRLLSKKALRTFLEFEETNLYIRGIVPLIGYTATNVYYKRAERFAGESKYNLQKMISFAWNGISSMSVKPLRFVSFCGFFIFFMTIILTIYAFISYLTNNVTPGWASTVIPLYFLGGVQLLCIGIIGEYLAKIFNEIKKRPRFIIEEYLNNNNNNNLAHEN